MTEWEQSCLSEIVANTQRTVEEIVNQSSHRLPIRLEIASRILAAMKSHPDTYRVLRGEMEYALKKGVLPQKFFAKLSLEYADALIAAHNETCKGESNAQTT